MHVLSDEEGVVIGDEMQIVLKSSSVDLLFSQRVGDGIIPYTHNTELAGSSSKLPGHDGDVEAVLCGSVEAELEADRSILFYEDIVGLVGIVQIGSGIGIKCREVLEHCTVDEGGSEASVLCSEEGVDFGESALWVFLDPELLDALLQILYEHGVDVHAECLELFLGGEVLGAEGVHLILI